MDLNAFKLLPHSLKLDLTGHIWRSHRILLDLNASKNLGSWKYWISSHSKNQPSWLSFNQARQLDSHPGCHSIKSVNWTAILAVTQSNQPVNPGGQWADLKGGPGGGQPPQRHMFFLVICYYSSASVILFIVLFFNFEACTLVGMIYLGILATNATSNIVSFNRQAHHDDSTLTCDICNGPSVSLFSSQI